jgi:hypothetical protein
MGAITDLAIPVPGLNFEHNALSIDLNDSGDGPDRAANGRGREVTDFHVHADTRKARGEMRSDGSA